jgi:rhamnogalacturonan endolyase
LPTAITVSPGSARCSASQAVPTASEACGAGSAAIDDNGEALWCTRLGHPDHVYIGDLDPDHPGLEIYYGIETRQKQNGMCMVDARTGKILWGFDKPTRQVHSQGLCSDIDPTRPGWECYSADTDAKKDFAFGILFDAKGNQIANENLGGFGPFAAYWDADLQRELILKGQITKRGQEPAQRIEGAVIGIVDLWGDWREEIITSLPGEMRIYTSTIPARDRRVTLMRDPIYRIDVATGSQAYYQPPCLKAPPK